MYAPLRYLIRKIFMITIAERLNLAYGRMVTAQKNSHFSEQSVALLAVSKKKPSNLIREAYIAGQRSFGESYVQEATDKIAQLTDLTDIQWHFIGPIQSNKSALIAENFSWVQSVDRLKIARRLNQQRPEQLPPLNILIQVNIDDEVNKSGCALDELNELAECIVQSEKLVLRGLMAIPKKSETEHGQRNSFKKLYTCYQELKSQYLTIDTLSMGMSGDIEAAINEGSNMVRIGTDIFGARD
jgi:hypothetical protein